MYQLIIRGPDGSEQVYRLGQDEGLVVGREDGCDVVLRSKRVSRRHARFFTEGEVLNVEDLGSQNGIFVGGARLSGITELRPGPAIEIGEFTLRVKRQDPRAVEAVSVDVNAASQAHLRGASDMAGRTFDLDDRKAIVGRDAAAELSIDNDSVSRRHAELRMEAGAVWVVRDLDSSNGTFVNGTKVKHGLDVRLKAGDKVRFGETHWVFALGTAAAPLPTPAGPSPRAKRLLAAGAALVVSVTVLALVLGPDDDVAAGEDLPLERIVAEHIAAGQAAMEEDKFEEAKAAFERALHEDPVNVDARALLRRAEREVEFGRLYKEASTKADLGRNEEALKVFFRISTESRFFSRARLKVQDLATVLLRKDGPGCREQAKKGKPADAVEVCRRYLDLRCLSDGDADAEKLLRAAEARAGRKDAWTCPTENGAWFGASSTNADATQELIVRYPERDLREVAALYAKGEIDAAQRALQKLKKGPLARTADELSEQLSLIAGRYKEGQAALLRGSLKEGAEAYEHALASDAKIMPATVVTFHAKQMRAQLAQLLHAEGLGLFEKGAYVEAHEKWSKGLDYQRNDGALLDGLTKLEKAGEEMLASSPGCDELKKVLRITRADPPSPVHQRAAELAKGCN
jgi:pSer/pThr/pTyr-binding forkhead associated (FHA) protein/tetratricopeptide (TPR) repeat protein